MSPKLPGAAGRPLLFLSFAVAAAALAAGCSSTPKNPPAPVRYTYTVGPHDVLALQVWGQIEARRERVVVAADGTVTNPVTGKVHKASGRTLEQLASDLKGGMSPPITNPLVSIFLVELRSAQVQVLGETRLQGPIPYRENLSVVEAISFAGGPIWAFAKMGDVRIIRGALSNPQLIEVDYTEIAEGDERDVYLQPGDIVIVPAKWVTRWDRYVTQLLAPLRFGATTAASAAAAGTTVGTSAIVSPFP